MNSGPLSHRTNRGAPRLAAIPSRTSTVPLALILKAGTQARASRVNSSVTFRILILLPLVVWSNSKSMAQISFGWVAVASPGALALRRLLRRRLGTCRPSSLHRRWTRLRLHCHPSLHTRAWTLRYPYRGWRPASSRRRLRRKASSGTRVRHRRWVERCWARVRQALRSETPKHRHTWTTTARLRRSGLRSFPEPPSSACRCREPGGPRCA
jgi:hypothetical protein